MDVSMVQGQLLVSTVERITGGIVSYARDGVGPGGTARLVAPARGPEEAAHGVSYGDAVRLLTTHLFFGLTPLVALGPHEARDVQRTLRALRHVALDRPADVWGSGRGDPTAEDLLQEGAAIHLLQWATGGVFTFDGEVARLVAARAARAGIAARAATAYQGAMTLIPYVEDKGVRSAAPVELRIPPRLIPEVRRTWQNILFGRALGAARAR